jgi:hypothetical protein
MDVAVLNQTRVLTALLADAKATRASEAHVVKRVSPTPATPAPAINEE